MDGDVVMENNFIKDSESKINATPLGDGQNMSMVETPVLWETMAKSASGAGTDADANNTCTDNLSLDSLCIMKRL